MSAYSKVVLFMSLLYVPAVGQKEPPLDKTIDYMAGVLDTAGDDQKILFGEDYRKEPCRIFFSDKITSHLAKPPKAYKTEVQFHLARIDPKSVKVEDTKSGIKTVKFETSDYDPVIFESASQWQETHGRIPKELELVSLPSYDFRFYNNDAANHFAKAFVHAIQLCGGKESPF